jgi:hypothetical protein
MYIAAINRPAPPTRAPRVPVTPALTGARPPAGPLPPSAAATLATQRGPNQASHAANR